MLKETNTPTLPRIEPGSPDPESDALTIRPVRPWGGGGGGGGGSGWEVRVDVNEELKFLGKFKKKIWREGGVEGGGGGSGRGGSGWM